MSSIRINAAVDDGSKAQLALGRILEAYGLADEQLHRDDEALNHFIQSAAILQRAHAKRPLGFRGDTVAMPGPLSERFSADR
jgi:hypothetical protein